MAEELNLSNLLKSSNENDRKKAIVLLAKNPTQENLKIILSIARSDSSEDVKSFTVKALGVIKKKMEEKANQQTSPTLSQDSTEKQDKVSSATSKIVENKQNDKHISGFICELCNAEFNNEIALKMHKKHCIKNGGTTVKSSIDISETDVSPQKAIDKEEKVHAAKNKNISTKANKICAESTQKLKTVKYSIEELEKARDIYTSRNFAYLVFLVPCFGIWFSQVYNYEFFSKNFNETSVPFIIMAVIILFLDFIAKLVRKDINDPNLKDLIEKLLNELVSPSSNNFDCIQFFSKNHFDIDYHEKWNCKICENLVIVNFTDKSFMASLRTQKILRFINKEKFQIVLSEDKTITGYLKGKIICQDISKNISIDETNYEKFQKLKIS